MIKFDNKPLQEKRLYLAELGNGMYFGKFYSQYFDEENDCGRENVFVTSCLEKYDYAPYEKRIVLHFTHVRKYIPVEDLIEQLKNFQYD